MFNRRSGLAVGTFALLLCGWTACKAAQQTSATYRVVADVFCSASPALAVGADKSQASISGGQFAIVGQQASLSYGVEEGYQATTEGFDTDRDGIPDHADTDDDQDGIPDGLDDRAYDTDNDGLNNVAMDADDDNDTFSDSIEDEITGTDPINRTDYLQLLDVKHSWTNTVVSWKSVTGKTNYWVARSVDLGNPTNWSVVAGPVAATGSVTSVSDTNGVPRGFYRVVIPR